MYTSRTLIKRWWNLINIQKHLSEEEITVFLMVAVHFIMEDLFFPFHICFFTHHREIPTLFLLLSTMMKKPINDHSALVEVSTITTSSIIILIIKKKGWE